MDNPTPTPTGNPGRSARRPPHIDFDAPETLAALRRRDEDMFAALFRHFYDSMRRVALAYVRSAESANEVVQESWLGIARGIGRFEGRSALKTWIFRIVVNQARSHAKRDSRSVPFSEAVLSEDESEPLENAFLELPNPRAGKWSATPRTWDRDPETLVLHRELKVELHRAIDSLPAVQQLVLTLRDIHGFGPQDVSELLNVSVGNQRVMLHRGRTKIREILAQYLSRETESA